MPLDMLPVIHAGSFELRVVELETKRLDEMQRRFGRGAEAGDVAGIWRDFRFNEDDVHILNDEFRMTNGGFLFHSSFDIRYFL